ncbi:MAG: vitamin B12-dependent ribonucleotide reductase [Planctomycetota bacterium]|jgi:ribonucleoside-diphosphate reductase alpha chain
MGPRAASPSLSRVSWGPRVAAIADDSGEAVFEQEVEAPEHWSDAAVGIVASRYFGGRPGSPEREKSVRDLVKRIAGTLAGWVREQGLGEKGVEERLSELLVWQRGAFNSPVWFNVGIDDHPQCSACFILSVEDDLQSILELARVEGLIFKRGSGAGSNLSRLRSLREPLKAGGTASGPVSFMRGYDAFAGVIKSGGRTRRAAKMQILDADHPDILTFVSAKAIEERKARALTEAGFTGGLDGEAYHSVAFQNSNLSVRVNDSFLYAVEENLPWTTHAVTTGEPVDTFPARLLIRRIAEGAWECGDPGLQYEDTIQSWHTCPASGRITASNPCSEYLFLDDTACNLASLNLLRYLSEEGSFAIGRFREDVELLLRSMEAIVDRSSYPTPRITERSHRFRPLGLGYANLGAMLMSLGLPYDSAAARGWAAAVTALLTGEAYRVSALMAQGRGPFEAFGENRAPFLEVLERHKEALDAITDAPDPVLGAARRTWAEALELAHRHGVRNAQVSVLAPTGTIAFLMDCDTTGVEPDLALVKYKRLAGGGTLKLVNRSVPRALRALGYDESRVTAVGAHLEATESIEGAPGLKDEHLEVFDCAIRPPSGERAIRPEGHLYMMAAVQPFLSGGISKTLNLPEEITAEEIGHFFLLAARLGLKSLAVFRESSKGVQPLGTHCVVDKTGDGCCG